MSLSNEQVRHIAHLARLALSEEEIALYSEQLSQILDYAQMIQRLDTAAIPPTAQVVHHAGVMRADAVEPALPREAALANAPVAEDGYFVARAILEES